VGGLAGDSNKFSESGQGALHHTNTNSIWLERLEWQNLVAELGNWVS